MNGILVYRIESPNGGSLWYNKDGQKTNIVKKIVDDNSPLKNMEMDFNPIYKLGGFVWLSTTKGLKGIKKWFSRNDLQTLFDNGFKMYNIYSTHYIRLEKDEVIIREDKIIKKKLVNHKMLMQKLYQNG